jgi:membrane protease YdiL (CAAX protease family)
MPNESPSPEAQQANPFSRPHVLRDLLIVGSPILLLAVAGNIVGIGTLPGGAIVNLGYVLAICIGGLLLQLQGSGWRHIGLARPASGWKTAGSGVGVWIAAVLIFVLTQVAIVTILTVLGQSMPAIDQSRFNPISGNVPLFLLMVILAWTTIAFGEELFYRAFLISRLVDHAAMGRGAAIIISAIIFAVVHFAEGPMGIFSNGAIGGLFGWIYLRSGRNLWITVIGHGLLNTFRFTLLYVGAV